MATRKTKPAAKAATKTLTRNGNPVREKKRSIPERIRTTAGQMRFIAELPMELFKQEYVSITGIPDNKGLSPYASCREAGALCDAGLFDAARAAADRVPSHSATGLPPGYEQRYVRQGILTIIDVAESRVNAGGPLGFVPWSKTDGGDSDD